MTEVLSGWIFNRIKLDSLVKGAEDRLACLIIRRDHYFCSYDDDDGDDNSDNEDDNNTYDNHNSIDIPVKRVPLAQYQLLRS